MNQYKMHTRLSTGASIAAMAACLLLAAPSYAVEQSAILQGHVANAAAGSKIVAVDTNSGARVEATVGSDGRYVLVGLRPGTYEVMAGKDKETVTLRVGTTSELNFDANVAPTETVVVTGYQTVDKLGGHEVHTSEVATSVSQEQIERLPQLDRNFLSFVSTAPGVSMSQDPQSKMFRAGATSADQINVFIDGQSMKNQVLKGGAFSQDTSRGNPFPMLAIDEYKVSTQNFKAEYEQAGTAIVTAITKTGGNEFHGSLFEEFQSKGMVEQPYFSRNTPKPDYVHHQYGLDLSGPIIQDKLFFYVAYEGTQEMMPSTIFSFTNPATPSSLSSLNGQALPHSFREDLFFGKLTWYADDHNTFEVEGTYHPQKDLRIDGGNFLATAQSNFRQENVGGQFKWTYRNNDLLNELSLEMADNPWEQAPVDNAPNATYQQVIPSCAAAPENCQTVAVTGGMFYHQSKNQSNWTFKDNLTLSGLDFYGQHIVKMGIKLARYKFRATEAMHRYFYDVASYGAAGATPLAAIVNVGNPDVITSDVEIGAFIQDDWTVNEHLTINAGIRWDYESNMMNENYITPNFVAQAIRNFTGFRNAGFNPEDFISNGSNRSPNDKMYQPRLGVSYDLNGDGETVFFGGGGRYYDRTIMQDTQMEYRRALAPQVTLHFGSGPGQIPWNPAYLTPAGLEAIGLTAGGQEIFALDKNTKVPYNDQFDIGIRQKLGDWQLGLTLSDIEGHHLFTWELGNRLANGAWCTLPNDLHGNAVACLPSYAQQPWGSGLQASGLGTFLISDREGRRTHYHAIYLTAEKPYTPDSGWGVTGTMTINDAQANGHDDWMIFDYMNPAAGGMHPAGGVDRWRFVGTAIFDGPWQTILSTNLTLASGAPYDLIDFHSVSYQTAPGVWQDVLKVTSEKLFPSDPVAFKQLDIRVAKDFTVFDDQTVTLDFQVYNVFDWVNKTWSGWNGGLYCPVDWGCAAGAGGNGPSRRPDQATTGVPREFQIGIKYKF